MWNLIKLFHHVDFSNFRTMLKKISKDKKQHAMVKSELLMKMQRLALFFVKSEGKKENFIYRQNCQDVIISTNKVSNSL